MSLAASRAVLRHSTFAVRRAGVRNASSTSEAANAAKDKTAEFSKKAQEGLSRVTSSAGATISKAGTAAAGALGKVGGRTGGLIGRIQSLVPTATHYSKLALEVGKVVAKERNMAPPNTEQFQKFFQPLLSGLRNPSTLLQQPANLINQARSASQGQWVSAGVVAAEVLGFFTVGEMIGRFKIVGYRSKAQAHH
ncbi:mitochondrial F1F0-ATP synthase-like protein g subunit [Dendryphion nanum]|uniref:Mitochondrial F1F0-ATP synthase-like protein g subunit n=1 Tax=Dendryphion nanum TaxID=256645 RepID=A0A9P9D4X8_9PLEO|nr:mitochondrial F1F0-ATP synthase-like protein g subunit [Dendryphion nanum]